MERESFENEEIAAILNEHFVSIKVDREERPDVDRIYMTFVQATTGSGGWPMSVWLTPDLKPFFGGTYFPPENRYGRPGFGSMLHADRRGLARAIASRSTNPARDVVEQLQEAGESWRRRRGGAASTADALDSAFSIFRRTFDSRLGGFGGAPKFPRSGPQFSAALLRAHARTRKRSTWCCTLCARWPGAA